MKMQGVFAVLFGVAAVWGTGPADARPLAVDDLDRVERVSGAKLSPDGGRVLYTVTTTDVAADSRRTSVWQVDWSGSAAERLTDPASSAHTPDWSPDGQWISFIREADGGSSQVWLMPADGRGEPRPVTRVEGGVSNYAWSPDSRRLAIVYRAERALRKGEDGKDVPEPWVIDRVRFKEDAGDGYLHDRIKPERIYLHDLQAHTFDPLTSGGEFDEDSPAWSPDGRHIAFVSNRGPDWQYVDYGDIHVVSSQPGSTPRRLTDFPGADRAPAWRPDGREIVYLQGSEPQYWMYNQLGLATVSVDGGAPRMLATGLDRDVGSPVFDERQSSIRFLVTDNRLRYPAEVPASDGPVTRLVEGDYQVESFATSNGRMVVVASSDRSPAEVHAVEHGRLRPLTRHNETWLRGVELMEAKDIEFVAADGERVHGLLTMPVGGKGGKRHPLVLWLHGGPYGQNGHEFDFRRQILAAHGYAVLHVNFRGSRGRGKTFGRGIFRDWGNRDVTDARAGVDHVVSMGVADPERLLVGGWSYGGFLTDFIIVSDARFKAAISGAGSPTKTSLYGTDLYAHGNELEWGTPWDETDLWMRVSRPLYQAGRVRTPTLFIHGAKDYNVPVSGSEQMYRALKTLRVPTQLVIYPGEHHGINRPSFARDLLQRYLDWYGAYVPSGQAGAPSTHGEER